MGGGDVVGELGARGRRQYRQTLWTQRERLLDDVTVGHPGIAGRELGDRPVGSHRQQRRDVAELQRQVDEHDAPRVRPVEHQRQVGGDDRFAHASLSRDDRDHLSIPPARSVARRRRTVRGFADGLRGAFARLERVHPMDRRDQVVPGKRLLEHLSRSGEHGSSEELAPTLHRHQDHACLRRVLREHLGRLHPVEPREPGIEHRDVRDQV